MLCAVNIFLNVFHSCLEVSERISCERGESIGDNIGYKVINLCRFTFAFGHQKWVRFRVVL